MSDESSWGNRELGCLLTVLYPKRKTVDQVGESKNLTKIIETQIRELTDTIPRLWVTERLRIPEGVDKYDGTVNYRLIADATGASGNIPAANAAYATAHGAANGDEVVLAEGDVYNKTGYVVGRSFLYFDTSSIGSGATILNATFSFYTNQQSEVNAGQTTLHIVEGVQDDVLALADFGDHLTKTTSGGSIAFAAIQDDTTNTIILNSTGRGWINKTGTTKLCLRLAGDIDNSTPTGDNSLSIQITPSQDEGCYLTINYTNAQSGQIWVESDDLHHIDENGAEQIGVKESDVDDTPVNGATTAPVSSNWAYDHAATFAAHKDRHDPEDGDDPLDTGAASEIATVQAAATGTSHSFARADHVHAINHGITNNHIVTIDDAGANASEFPIFTANGLQGLTVDEMLPIIFADPLPENTAITLDTALGATGKYSGIVELGTLGATAIFGDCLYQVASDGQWELAKADVVATSDGKLGMCLAAGDASDGTLVLLWGKVRADAAFPAMSVRRPVYIDAATAGDVTTTAPSGTSGFVVRIIGYANTADELYFHPDNYFTVIP